MSYKYNIIINNIFMYNHFQLNNVEKQWTDFFYDNWIVKNRSKTNIK